jgi:hypothetical protein
LGHRSPATSRTLTGETNQSPPPKITAAPVLIDPARITNDILPSSSAVTSAVGQAVKGKEIVDPATVHTSAKLPSGTQGQRLHTSQAEHKPERKQTKIPAGQLPLGQTEPSAQLASPPSPENKSPPEGQSISMLRSANHL